MKDTGNISLNGEDILWWYILIKGLRSESVKWDNQDEEKLSYHMFYSKS